MSDNTKKNRSPREELIFLAHYKMPFGKYKDYYLSDIPEAYYLWFRQKGFPSGELGKHMQAVLELKINGLSGLLKKIRSL